MKVFHQISLLRDELKQARQAGKRIGFVPTMGNLHAAHIELVKKAQQTNDVVVCSIFVNGLQFNDSSDLDKYPRTLQADIDRLEVAGCDYLFNPDDAEMYPNGTEVQTRVICPTMTGVLCGAARPGHFDGVTTVVSKLFNIVQPDEAVFGLKDYQQLAVIRRMVEDLCMPICITAMETHREGDGLAMSSRNGFITATERPKVVILSQQLNGIREAVQSGREDFSQLENEAIQAIEQAGFKVDYFSICCSKTLQRVDDKTEAITVLGAMFTEGARLIDNLSFSRVR
jgi:pantoate--beta-alanine ligase